MREKSRLNWSIGMKGEQERKRRGERAGERTRSQETKRLLRQNVTILQGLKKLEQFEVGEG